jgi:hypothetical protein
MERNKREWKAKELTTGHHHDRQSGTGRVYNFIHLEIDQEKLEEDTEMWETSKTNKTDRSM